MRNLRKAAGVDLKWTVWLGPAAAFGLCIILAPIQSYIWHGADAPSWLSRMTWLQFAAAKLHESMGYMLGAEPYDAFGRLMIFVYLGTLAGTRSLMRSSPRSRHVTGRIVVASLFIATIADFISYWIAGIGDPDLRFWSFWCAEVPALLVCLLALAALGVLRTRTNSGSKFANRLCILAPFLALGFTTIVQYIPHGPMLAISLTICCLTAEDT